MLDDRNQVAAHPDHPPPLPPSAEDFSSAVVMVPPRPWWKGNWSPLWVMGTTYLLLFVAYLGIAEFGHKSAAFILHTLFALTFVLACAANLFHTPSHGEVWRELHRWVGWTAIWSGVAVVLTGYYMVFRRGYATALSTAAENVFVVTGTFQIVVQVAMLYAIRVMKSPWYHMVCASVLFYGPALMPAANRLPQILHFQDSDAFTFAIMPIGPVLIYFSILYFSKKMDMNETVTGAD